MKPTEWEEEIASLLHELSNVQSDLLAMLGEKRQLLLAGKLDELELIQPREQELAQRLQNCHRIRHELLTRAEEEGLPATSIRSLASAIEGESAERLGPKVGDAAAQTRLLQHTSLSNWVYVQKSLLHLSQLLEIIATGGRSQPTYGSAGNPRPGGAMVDQAV